MTDNLKAERRGGDRLTIYFFRITGGLLLLLILVPFYRLVGTEDSDRVARDVIDAADLSRSLFLLGTLITLTIGVLASRVIDSSNLERALQNVERRLVAIPLLWFAGSLALVSGLLSLVFSLSVLEGKPNLIDAMAQLTHARFVAEGHLSGPVDRFRE